MCGTVGRLGGWPAGSFVLRYRRTEGLGREGFRHVRWITSLRDFDQDTVKWPLLKVDNDGIS